MVEWLQCWTHDLKVLCNSGLKRALDSRPEGPKFGPRLVIRVWNPRPRSVNSQLLPLQTHLRFCGMPANKLSADKSMTDDQHSIWSIITVAIGSSSLRWTVCFSKWSHYFEVKPISFCFTVTWFKLGYFETQLLEAFSNCPMGPFVGSDVYIIRVVA